jgi:hypothetical protein
MQKAVVIVSGYGHCDLTTVMMTQAKTFLLSFSLFTNIRIGCDRQVYTTKMALDVIRFGSAVNQVHVDGIPRNKWAAMADCIFPPSLMLK